MHSFSELNNASRKGSQRRIAPSLVIGSPQPSASSSSRGRAVSAVIASQSPALTTTSVKVKDLLRRHRNFRDQTYAVSMFPLHIAMLAVYIIMIQEVSPPMRIQPVSVGIHNSFISQPSVAYNGIKAHYGFDQVSSAKQWWDFLADFTESMYPRCPNGGKDSAATCKANDFSESDDAGERNYNGGSISRRDPTYTVIIYLSIIYIACESSSFSRACPVPFGMGPKIILCKPESRLIWCSSATGKIWCFQKVQDNR